MSKTTKPMKTVIFKETGEVRPPKKGEWYKSNTDYRFAPFDYNGDSPFPIYTMETERFKPEIDGKYMMINSDLKIREFIWRNDSSDNDFYNAGNCFPLDKDLNPIIEKLRKVFEEAQK